MKIRSQKIHTVFEVLRKIKEALYRKKGLSLSRFASGEAFVLAHGNLISLDKIPWWVEYAGVKLPNEQARQKLLAALYQADIVGLSTDYKRWECAPLLDKILTRHNVRPKFITGSTVNWGLHNQTGFYRLISRFPVALVGRLAPAAAPVLRKKGINVVSAVSLEGFQDLPRVEDKLLTGSSFRIALVAAGIPATVLCPRLARQTKCVAIDYGHVINDLIKPGFNINDLDKVKEEWKRTNRRV